MNIDEAIKNAIEIAEIQYIHSVSQRERERIADTIEAITVLQKKRKRYRWHDLRKSPNDLPEIYGDSDGYIVQTRRVEQPFIGCWDGREWTDEEADVVDEVIAWMPLPEPYREVDDEKNK